MIAFLAGHLWWVLGLLLIAGVIAAPAVVWRLRWQVALLCACAAAGVYGARTLQLEQSLAAVRLDAATAAVAYSNSVRDAEAAHATELADLSANAAKEQADAQHKIDDLSRRLRAGDLRLRQRLAVPAAAVAAASSADSGSADGAPYAQLARQDVEDLLRIAAEGDDAIRERNLAVAVALKDREYCVAPAVSP